MTLSLLIFALMVSTLVALAGILVVDAVRGLARWSARRAGRSAAPAPRRSSAAGARDRRAMPTRS